MKKEKAIRPSVSQPGFTRQLFNIVMAVSCVALLSPGNYVALAQQTEPQNAAPASEAPKIPNDQLDSLVAPIALYPDPLLSQVLVASTYPLEIIQLQQWLEKHKDLKDNALVVAVEKENWDPSIQGMAALPDAVKQLAENIKWTTDLGNAFLAQQSDVMDAVQRMRMKAKDAGNLKSNEQMKVETKVIETKTVVVIDQANPKVVYVPSYNPVVVYGPPVYPYPPIYYPPATGAILAFGAGIAIGAAWGNGGWGYNYGWGSNNSVTINNNNTFVNNANKANISNRPSTLPAGGSGNWQHNPQHRGNAPYGNRQTANKYAGSGARPGAGAGADGAGNRPGGGAGNRPGGGAGAGNRPGGASTLPANRPSGGAGAGSRPGAGAGAGTRPRGGASTMPANRPSGGGGDRIGNHSVSSGASRGGSSAFGGGSGNSARASSSRGGHSMGGGGFSGGGRAGGGGRRR